MKPGALPLQSHFVPDGHVGRLLLWRTCDCARHCGTLWSHFLNGRAQNLRNRHSHRSRADRGDILGIIMKDDAAMSGVGIRAGIGLVAALGPAARSLLFLPILRLF